MEKEGVSKEFYQSVHYWMRLNYGKADKCEDVNGKIVEVTPKNPNKHQSSHILDQHPTVHFNTDYILKYPDEVIKNPKSSNPRSIENRNKGIVKQYIKKDFIKKLKIGGHEDESDVTSVFVLYCKNGYNYTLTRIIRPNVPVKTKMGKLK